LPKLCLNPRIVELIKNERGEKADQILCDLKTGNPLQGDNLTAFDSINDFVCNEAEIVEEYMIGESTFEDPAYIMPAHIMQFDGVFFLRLPEGEEIKFFTSKDEAAERFINCGYDDWDYGDAGSTPKP
jgi:hypothetical protein